MKRLTLLLSLIIVLLFVSACGGGDGSAPETDAGGSDQSESPAAEPESDSSTLPPPIITESDGGDASSTGENPQTEPEAEQTVPEEEAVEQPQLPWSADDFGYGTQIHGNASVGDPADTMRIAHDQLGLDWIKMQIQWWLIHPDPDVDQWFFYDGVVEEAHKKDLKLMVSIVGAPAWTRADGIENGPPDDYNQYAEFLTELLQRYDGKIDAIEVWNEQNLDREWATANGVNPEDYVTFLKLANETIKAHDPNIIVISGALAPTGGGDWIGWIDDFQWLDRALAAGLLDHADCIGVRHNG